MVFHLQDSQSMISRHKSRGGLFLGTPFGRGVTFLRVAIYILASKRSSRVRRPHIFSRNRALNVERDHILSPNRALPRSVVKFGRRNVAPVRSNLTFFFGIELLPRTFSLFFPKSSSRGIFLLSFGFLGFLSFVVCFSPVLSLCWLFGCSARWLLCLLNFLFFFLASCLLGFLAGFLGVLASWPHRILDFLPSFCWLLGFLAFWLLRFLALWFSRLLYLPEAVVAVVVVVVVVVAVAVVVVVVVVAVVVVVGVPPPLETTLYLKWNIMGKGCGGGGGSSVLRKLDREATTGGTCVLEVAVFMNVHHLHPFSPVAIFFSLFIRITSQQHFFDNT